MPFKSEKQRKFLYSQKPKVAEKFARDSKSKGGSIKKKAPKGYHYMPNGKLMKGAKHLK